MAEGDDDGGGDWGAELDASCRLADDCELEGGLFDTGGGGLGVGC